MLGCIPPHPPSQTPKFFWNLQELETDLKFSTTFPALVGDSLSENGIVPHSAYITTHSKRKQLLRFILGTLHGLLVKQL